MKDPWTTITGKHCQEEQHSPWRQYLRQRAAGRFQWADACKVFGTVFKAFGDAGHYLLPVFRQVSRGTMCVWALGCVWCLGTPWTVAHQAPLSMELSRQECWSGLPFPPPGDLPDPGAESTSPASPASAGGFFTTEPPGKLGPGGQCEDLPNGLLSLPESFQEDSPLVHLLLTPSTRQVSWVGGRAAQLLTIWWLVLTVTVATSDLPEPWPGGRSVRNLGLGVWSWHMALHLFPKPHFHWIKNQGVGSWYDVLSNSKHLFFRPWNNDNYFATSWERRSWPLFLMAFQSHQQL